MSLLEFHGRLGSTAMLFALGLGIWGLFLYFRKQGPSGGFLGGLVIGEVVFILQAVLGWRRAGCCISPGFLWQRQYIYCTARWEYSPCPPPTPTRAAAPSAGMRSSMGLSASFCLE